MYNRIQFFGCFILFLLCIPLTIVNAEVKTFTVNGKEYSVDTSDAGQTFSPSDSDDALDGEKRQVSGDKVNPVIELGDNTKPCHEGEDKETGIWQLFCVAQQTHLRESVENVLEWGHREAASYNLKPLNDTLEGARMPLTPAALMDPAVWTRFTNAQFYSWIARACDFKKQNDGPLELVRDVVSKERMMLGQDIYIPPVVENLEFYKSIMSTATTLNQYYQKATELVKLSTAYTCGVTQDAIEVKGSVKESQGRGIWEILIHIFDTIWEDLQAKNISMKKIYETARFPYSEEISGGLIQADDKTFTYSRVSDERKAAIRANAGIIETFRPCEVKFEPEEYDGEIVNQYFVVGEDYEQPDRFQNANLMEFAKNFLQAMILPAALHGKEHKMPIREKPCGSSDIPPGPTTSTLITQAGMCTPEDTASGEQGGSGSSASVTAAATKLGIPNCVLDAVYNIESSRGANSSCTPNVCGAVGPFAITVGYTGSNQGGQCSKDEACKQCAAGYCPNTLKDSLSELGYTAADMCDTGKAAEAAASLLKGKAGYFDQNLSGSDTAIAGSTALQNAIIYAGNSYFGSNHTFTTGDNIEPGCSYGESILKKYCGVASYSCGSRNFAVN